MAIKWSFPSNNYGTINGIGEAGIETFKGNPYRSLAREICQNSLDAKRQINKPVRVEFSCVSVSTNNLPDFDDLRNAISLCGSFWKKQGNRKTVEFFAHAYKVSKQDKIPILRISDFNTTGLVGSDKEYNTPWQNLVKASGVSDKGGGAGGSFGIGKSAPFACSDLRMVFYATKDKDGLRASQGIARLVSFEKPAIFNKDAITTGIGYYGESDRNRAIERCLSPDPSFRRMEIGTDVFVIGFTNKVGWEKEVIAAVLDDFLMSIYNGLLEVKVGSTVISRATLADRIGEFKEEASMAYNYYQVLTSPNAIVINDDFDNLGEIELHLLIQNGLHRRVYMGRTNGMKVFDQNRFPSAIQFAGVCILKGEKINEYFRGMENPQHNAWEPKRYDQDRTSEARAKKRKTGLFRYIKDKVLEYGRVTTVEEEDAEGVGEFLPDDLPQDGGNDKKEALNDSTKSIDISMSAVKASQKGYEFTTSDYMEDAEDASGNPDDEGYGESGSKDFGNDKHNLSDDGTGYGNNPGDNAGTNGTGDNRYDKGDGGDSKQEIRKTFEIQLMQVRLMPIKQGGSRYRLIFVPEKTSGEGYLKFKLSGEQSNLDVNVSNAKITGTDQCLLSSKNIIYLSDIALRKRMSIEFDVDFTERSSMEVSLYGYKG